MLTVSIDFESEGGLMQGLHTQTENPNTTSLTNGCQDALQQLSKEISDSLAFSLEGSLEAPSTRCLIMLPGYF